MVTTTPPVVTRVMACPVNVIAPATIVCRRTMLMLCPVNVTAPAVMVCICTSDID